MSDFFTLLATRSLGRLDSVHPRRVSRFEPEPGTGIDFVAVEIDPEHDELLGEESPVRNQDTHQSGFKDNEPEQLTQPIDPPARSTRPNQLSIQSTAEYADEHNLGNDAGPTRRPEDRTTGRLSHSAHSVEPMRESPPAQSAQTSDAPTQQRLISQEDQRDRNTSRQQHAPAARTAAARRADPQPAEHRTGNNLATRQAERETTRLNTVPAARETDKETSFEPPASSPARVSVSIGRIEVKAPESPRPVPPQRPARAQPQLSLTDYLQRAQRGRK